MRPGPGGEQHPRRSFLSDFILGSQDGLVNVLGILLGLSAATTNLRIILIATLAALGAESISMGAVAYTSTLARRRLYLSEVEREMREMRDVPEIEREEVRAVLSGWGLDGSDRESLLDHICRYPRVMLEFMMAFELRLAPVEEHEARNSAAVVGGATVAGSFVPLVPFLIPSLSVFQAVTGSLVLSAAALFTIGWYEARTTIGSVWKSGLRMVLIGLGAGFAGFLIGHFLGASGV
ncbi:MAG: VIT1/CCC1 transporter family protein [Thermoplasmata archaeon]|nr:VIT1/CCC1 transporter family protein [Thermoplasmata archaeon]